jgi:hypothetical protein
MANALTRTADGKVVVVGETESFGKGDFDFFMIELQKR